MTIETSGSPAQAGDGAGTSPETQVGAAPADAATEAEEWTVPQDRVPEPVRGGPRLSPYRWAVTVSRRSWRGLTSMRTALILLFLLAVAALPGSLLPQKNINPASVARYYQSHPSLGPLLERTGFFSVFSSVWFSAIYLLLFISLVGCVTPRLKAHWIAVRRQPPDAPARLDRMPLHASDLAFDAAPADAAARLRVMMRARRYRSVTREHADGSVTVSGEKGYLKETGNLLFHFSLVVLLIGVAYGAWFGWHANRLLVAGPDTAFCDTLTQYDEYSLGARVSPGDLEPFCVRLDTFQATYLSNGQPTEYTARVRYTVGDSSSTWIGRTLRVNDPLRLPRANVYLLGHGYAPIIKYTDKYGASQTRVAPFLPFDGALTSTGVAEFPDVNIDPKTGTNTDPTTFTKQQVGFAGVYVPTAQAGSAISAYPQERNPMLILTPYFGDLGLDNGVPQSVYELNQGEIASGALKKMTDAPIRLRPGQSATLPDGTTVQFLGTRAFATLAVRYDPGEKIVLVGAVLLIIGLLLSLTGRRRRVWFRLRPGDGPGPRSIGVAGGLARAEYASFPIEFESIIKSAGGE